MVEVHVDATGGVPRAVLVDDGGDAGDTDALHVIEELGPVATATPDDVPPRFRSHPRVVRWFAERDAGVHTVPEDVVKPLRADLKEMLLLGDRRVVEDLVYAFTAQFGTACFIERMLVPVLHDIGDTWADGRCTTADERLVSAGLSQALRVVRGPMPPRRLSSGGALDVLLFNPDGERHAIAVEVLEMRLQDAEHHPIAIEGEVPTADLVARARAINPDLILGSVTMPSSLPSALVAGAQLARALPRTPVVLGGQALDHVPADLPRGVRVIPHATSTDAVLVADAIGGRGPGHVLYAE